MKTTRFIVYVTRIVFLAMLGGATIAVLSCSDGSPLGVASGLPRANSNLNDSLLLSCTPLAYDSATQTIGPLGGTISVGPHAFTVPAGALDSDVTITAVVPPDSVNRVLFQPDGLRFNSPASLTMSYANCNTLGLLVPRRVVQIDTTLAILGVLHSVDSKLSRTVTGKVPHFSDYAVAW
jgi:hypothetical protein